MNDDTDETDDRFSRRRLLAGAGGRGVFGALRGAPTAAASPATDAPPGTPARGAVPDDRGTSVDGPDDDRADGGTIGRDGATRAADGTDRSMEDA